jgi:hypothetical protein
VSSRPEYARSLPISERSRSTSRQQSARNSPKRRSVERNVEGARPQQVRLAVAESISGNPGAERLADRPQVLGRNVFPAELLRWGKVGERCRVCGEETLPDGLAEHLAEWDEHVPNRLRRLALSLKRADQLVNVLRRQLDERRVAESGEDVPVDVALVCVEG